MLNLFYTEVIVLCGSIKSIDCVAFVLYRSVSVCFIRNPCSTRFHRVNTLGNICTIQKLAVLFGSIESIN